MQLEVQDMEKSFNGRTVLDNIHLSVKPHEIVCILGHSGCGKSTLLNMIAGFLLPDSGTITIDGKPINGPSKQRGVVFQEHALFPWSSVLDNVAFGPEVQGMRKKEAKALAQKYLQLVGLESYAKHYPHELSGGMKQRVGIARALAAGPDMLLMDEPFGALDILTRDLMQKELLRICHEVKPTVLFVTHSISEAIAIGDRVVIMKHGEIASVLEVSMKHPRSFQNNRFGQLMSEIESILMEDQTMAVI